jgi:hypothetical protein
MQELLGILATQGQLELVAIRKSCRLSSEILVYRDHWRS